MIDFIGDIHGHADELIHLLTLLDYRQDRGVFTHPTRRVLFIGDYIDRGDQIATVLEIVRGMVDRGSATALLGNHEFNAMAYHTPNPNQPGEFLRPHTPGNTTQHAQTLNQLSPAAIQEAVEWFRTLPAWLEDESFRAVHACWDEELVRLFEEQLHELGRFTTRFLVEACTPASPLHHAVEIVLKGKEATLPPNVVFHDKDGRERRQSRTRWYLPTEGQTFRTYALDSREVDCDDPLPLEVIRAARPYPSTERPVFVGHYWLTAATPAPLAKNVACLDYSIAKNGMLCAYRFDGEPTLDASRFVCVPARS